jgi:hypothetical protein
VQANLGFLGLGLMSPLELALSLSSLHAPGVSRWVWGDGPLALSLLQFQPFVSLERL